MNPLDLRWQMVRGRWPIRVKNTSGEVIPPFSVLRISDWANSNNEVVYSVAKPNTTFQRRYLVSGPFAIGSGSSDEGLATFLDKAAPVAVSGSPSIGEEWGATSGQWYLSQHGPGFFITGSHTETTVGKKIVMAIQHTVQIIYGKADTAISVNSSGTVRVYGGVAGGESDTSFTIPGCYNKTVALADEAEVTVSWPNGQPYVMKLVC